jgi:hypothetical protein
MNKERGILVAIPLKKLKENTKRKCNSSKYHETVPLKNVHKKTQYEMYFCIFSCFMRFFICYVLQSLQSLFQAYWERKLNSPLMCHEIINVKTHIKLAAQRPHIYRFLRFLLRFCRQ